MKCPNCTNLHDSLKEKLSITRKCPIECSECRTKFFIKRPFSFWISDFLWKAGAIYINISLYYLVLDWSHRYYINKSNSLAGFSLLRRYKPTDYRNH